MTERRLHLGVSISSAWTGGTAWRRPDSRVEDLHGAGLFIDIARAAERARLDFVFRADGVVLDRDKLDRHPGGLLDPVPILAALASVTTRIGLVGTASTSFEEPYNLARAFGTLDLVSDGRAGWNIVTSQQGERNFGQNAIAGHEDRYARASEFVDVVRGLWASWPRESIVVDRASGRYADTDRIRSIDHHGRFFDVEGPLNVPTSRQGAPVLFQAGASDRGRDFAARYADAIFAAAPDDDGAAELTSDLRRRAAALGRDCAPLVLPGAHLYLGETEQEARALYREIRADDDIADGYERLARTFGVDFRPFPLDEPLPAGTLPPIATLRTSQTHAERFRRLFEDDRLTLRRVIEDHVLTGAGHWRIVGTAEQAADAIAARFHAHAEDGNVFIPGEYPETLRLFFEQVVPILQDRGEYPREYAGTSLREHLGLPVPSVAETVAA